MVGCGRGSEEFPQFAKVLIAERDEWLAQQLWSSARNDVIQRALPDGTVLPAWPNRVVAVVGAGHAPGMKAYWQRVAVEGGVRADLATSFEEYPVRRWDGLHKLVRILCALFGAVDVNAARMTDSALESPHGRTWTRTERCSPVRCL